MLVDNVLGDVETSVYASEYNCFRFEVFFISLKFFLMVGCVYMITPCMPVSLFSMHVFRGSVYV